VERAGQYAEALKPYTALPEAVVYRWVYLREVGREGEALEELRLASERTDHLYVAFCYALTPFRRGRREDLEKALSVLNKKQRPSYNDRLLPFVLAEHDYKTRHWPERALEAASNFTKWAEDVAALMDSQAVRCLVGRKAEAVEASKALLE